jgi:hypothetical protein
VLRIIVPSLAVLALPALCLKASAASPKEAAGPPKVALLDAITFTVAGIPKTVHERDRFFARFRQTLDGKGWATLAPRPQDWCAGVADCLASVAGLGESDYALRLSGEGNLKYGYTINLELYSAATSQTQRTTAFCDICNTDRMAEIAADFAAKLLTAAASDAQAARARAKVPLALAAAPPAVAAKPPKAVVTATPTPPAPPSGIRWIPWTMTAVGVAGVAFGTRALIKDGDATGSPYSSSPSSYAHDAYSSKGIGLASVIGGGVLAAAGIVWIVATPSKSTTIAASPSRVAVSVRF